MRHDPFPNNPHSDFRNTSSTNDSENSRENLNHSSVKENNRGEEMKSEVLRHSVLLDELENWVDQYRKDTAYWGIGSGPIFTISVDSNGNVERVVVHEDEILTRSGHRELDDLTEVNMKISHAKSLAREMESGKNVIPRNSSVAKLVVSGEPLRIMNEIHNATLPSDLPKKLSRGGFFMLCGFVVVWAARKFLTSENSKVEFTSLEKEMMRRKIKSRTEKEDVGKVTVELVQPSLELPMVSTERPELDQRALKSSILRMKAESGSKDFDDKIQEIRDMARRARKIEGGGPSLADGDGEENQILVEDLPDEAEMIEQHSEEDADCLISISEGVPMQATGINGNANPSPLEKKKDDFGLSREPSTRNRNMQASSRVSAPYDRHSTIQDLEDIVNTSISDFSDAIEATKSPDSRYGQTTMQKKDSTRKVPKVIISVKEARDYLSKKCDKQENQVRVAQETIDNLRLLNGEASVGYLTSGFSMNNNMPKPAIVYGASDFPTDANACDEGNTDLSQGLDHENDDPEDAEEEVGVVDFQSPRESMDDKRDGSFPNTGQSVTKENWMERNFHQLEPVLKKIGTGFRDNYMVAREKVNEELNNCLELPKFESSEDQGELEWMEDDNLREIVFQVRENELAGLDPFYSMDDKDKAAFFEGLEKKVEKENAKLLNLHGWIHSNIENIDYGTGIFFYSDSPQYFSYSGVYIGFFRIVKIF